MKIQDLLKMDMGSCVEWLIENQYNYGLILQEMSKDEFDIGDIVEINGVDELWVVTGVVHDTETLYVRNDKESGEEEFNFSEVAQRWMKAN